MQALVDTGAQITVVLGTLFDAFQVNGFTVVKNPVSATTANGSEL